MTIAFFDSGIGGITVLSEAVKQLPQENFLYFADTLHVPYGTKSKAQVMEYVQESAARIMREEVQALVIACNTATSIAAAELRKIYSIPIIGMEPAVKPAVEMNRNSGKRVLVFATPLTLTQSKYNELVARVDDHGSVDSLPLPELVGYCENLNFDRAEMTDYFAGKLASFDLNAYGTVVLGCTHYPFYKGILREILPEHIEIIDGSRGTVSRLRSVLGLKEAGTGDSRGRIQFMCSSDDAAYITKMEKAFELFTCLEG
ncbi:glutamate racemase [Paenibacillus sp. P96]|uniref:Glutamate racemase n=1 Tax=Paenibacillus zeirhizosphaerae TaxID=2987519 RepID=A0ABT9FRL7_9BACL|nr:glutamate racemase [Paenibacillus sp. P96]MDP4097373.1 glutamate racemase [Paenibacillus sp. P96]